MQEIKDTHRALVHVAFDGTVRKQFKGAYAKERFNNERRVLEYLEEKGCDFVPRVISADPEDLVLVTSSCGARVERIRDEKVAELFAELETYGVSHDDRFARNITYDGRKGRFCIIDFEFAVILETGEGFRLEDALKKPAGERPDDAEGA
jgi:tRNA A-37 threonylcarbamoyl transferase component Bud32